MNSNFLQRLPLLDDSRLRRWAPALLAALIAQAVLVAALPQAEPDSRRARRTVLADDTPTLLRWSRKPAATPAASLQAIPLQGLAALPPPPPSTLPNGAFATAPTAAATPAEVKVEAEGVGLPRQPGEAFRLARQVAQAERPQQPPLVPLVALQRRQWWLLPGQDQALQALWNSGREQTLPPALGSLPEGVASRTVAAAAAAPLALGELHARSLLAGDQLWLLWRQGPTLWLLRGPLAGAPALTDP